MPDHVTLPGIGEDVAVDTIDGDKYQLIKQGFGVEATFTYVSEDDPLPVVLPPGAATQATLASILAKIIAAPATEATLAALLAKIITAPSTEAKQDAANSLLTTQAGYLDGLESGSAAILAKLITAPSTEAKQDTLIAKDFATQTTLAAVLAKIIAAPATEAKQDTLIAKDFATQTTLAALLAKIIAAPATEAKQDATNSLLSTQAGYLDGLEAVSAAILAKLIVAPATESKQDTLIAKDFATQTTLAAVLAKIIAAPATEAKQDTIIGHVDGLETVLGTTAGAAVITDANGTVQQYLRGLVKRWVDALGAGTAAVALRVTQASDSPAATAAKQPALGTSGTPSADVITVQGAASGTPHQTNRSYRATYSAYAFNIAFVSSGGTGSFVQLQGSATKTIRITRVSVSGTLTTGAVGDVLLWKTSTAASGGSPVTASPGGGGIAKHDSGDGAATATLTIWSTSPSSVGTTVGGVRVKKMFAPTTAIAPAPVEWNFGDATGRAIYLRGTAEYFQVYLNFASFTGASFNCDIEWTEE